MITVSQQFKKLGLYFIMLIMLLCNYTSYYCYLGIISKEEALMIPLVVVSVPFVIRLLKKNTVVTKSSIIVLVILTANCVLTSMLDNITFPNEVFMLLGAIATAFMLNNLFKKEEIIDCYIILVTGLAVYSLLATYIILPAYMSGIVTFFPRYVQSNRSFVNMYFAMANYAWGVPRNCGFCREPGVYQFFLLIALFFSIEKKEQSRNNLIRICILIFTLLSTFSAVAYVEATVAVLICIKKYSPNPRKAIIILSFFTALILVLYQIVINNTNIYSEFLRTFGKWNFESAHGSLMTRLSGITSNLSLFFEKPLLGNGLVTSWLIIIERYGYVDVTGTTLIGFSAFGIVFGTVIHILLWRACKSSSFLNTSLWFGILLLSSLSQNLFITNLLWFFLFTGI